jgi:uncharacterized protein YndB with AHSA1/START domain
MSVTSIEKDPTTRTMRITASFDAPVDAVWALWADPRLLERWWGPPTYPATVTEHDFRPGGKVEYHMTGPEGDRHGGWWRLTVVEPSQRIEFDDGFSDETGAPNPEMPVTAVAVTFEAAPDGGTRMVITSTFPSTEVMEQMIEMGMEEGMAAAMGQMDALLA